VHTRALDDEDRAGCPCGDLAEVRLDEIEPADDALARVEVGELTPAEVVAAL
jgi:hypothetical protein